MKPTLLIMAAGMGSRYGGLKQLDPIGPNGAIIMHYSIHDAIRAGFGKIVFIIRRAFAEEFKMQVAAKYEGKIEIEYVFQELDSFVNGYRYSPEREKPWGTGHAILVAKDLINEPFAVINADDYYGASSFIALAQRLSSKSDLADNDYAMVGFALSNTLSEYGHVSRGVCECDHDMYLRNITERLAITKTDQGATCNDEEGNAISFTGNEIVSMNLWAFTPSFFDHLAAQFAQFLSDHGQELKSEFFIPTVVANLMHSGTARVKVIVSGESWFGITYREDKERVVAAIAKLTADGVYPENLWEDK